MLSVVGIKSKIKKVARWFVAALLLPCLPLFSIELSTGAVEALQEAYSKLTFEQLLGEYNGVIEYRDELRAKFETQLPEGPHKREIISNDDMWCSERQKAWEAATQNQDTEELSRIIILEYLRCGEMQKLLEGSY